MKAEQRRHLKENVVAAAAAKVVATVESNPRKWIGGGIAILVVVLGLAAFTAWRNYRADAGGADLGIAMAIEQAPIVPAPTLPGATQTPGTYPTEDARREAALKAFEDVAANYGPTRAGVTARYHVGILQIDMGRFDDAYRTFDDLAASATGLYGSMARMGRAKALLYAGKYDDAATAFTELAADRDGPLPVDGVLMQLGEALAKAGKKDEARAAYRRVVVEFPNSPYAADAQRQITQLG